LQWSGISLDTGITSTLDCSVTVSKGYTIEMFTSRAVESEVSPSDFNSDSGKFRLSDSNSDSGLIQIFSCISYFK